MSTSIASTTESAPPLASVANAEGIFENPEKVIVGGLPVGCCAEFQLAESSAGIRVGFWLHTRHPKNTSTTPATVTSTCFPDRTAALEWLVHEIAAKFFSDNKTALRRLREWWKVRTASVLPPNVSPAIVEAFESVEISHTIPSISFDSILIDQIERNPSNKRRVFDVDELAESIKAQGFLLQPVALRDLGEGACPRYRLIAGERRWRAHQKLGWKQIDARIFGNVSDEVARELALIENLQRENLNAMEEAEELAELRDAFKYTAEQLADRTGKKVESIKHALQLVLLPDITRNLIRDGVFTAAHGRALRARKWSAMELGPLSELAAKLGVSASGLGDAGRPIDAGFLQALEVDGRAVNIGGSTCPFAEGDEFVVHADDGGVWHLSPREWDGHVRQWKANERERQKKDRARFAGRVEAGLGAGVNLKLADLDRAKTPYCLLRGDAARYAAYVPSKLQALGVDGEGAEVVVCLAPDKIRALRAREAAAISQDRAAKLPALRDLATKVLDGPDYVNASAQAAEAFIATLVEAGKKIDIPLLEANESAMAAVLANASKDIFGEADLASTG